MRFAILLLPLLGLGLAACSSSSGGGGSPPAKTYIIMPNGQSSPTGQTGQTSP